MNRIFVLLAVIAAGLVLFIVLSTGKSGDSPGGGAGGSTGAGGASGQAKVMRLSLDSEPKTLDPIGITDTISDGVARKVHSGLVRFERKGEQLVIGPDLAERWEVSPDETVYTFHLRKGVRFQNGRELKAADAAYSLLRLLTPESKRPEWLMPMVKGSEACYRSGGQAPAGIIAPDEYTLRIELNAPFAPFIQHLCTVSCSVVPREAVEDKSKPFSRFPVGAGPFRMAEWRDNERVVLTRHDDYFRGRPKLDGVTFFIVKEPNTRLEKYFAGELDAVDIPYGRMQEAVARAGRENVLEYVTLRTNYLGISMPNGAFTQKADLKPYGTNKRLRQALNYAIDREYLCEKVLEGRGIPAKGILPPGIPGFKPGRPGWPKDLAKAKELLAQAGYPDPAALPPIALLHRNDPNTMKIVQAIQHDFEALGLRVSLEAREWNAFLEAVEIEPKQMFVLGWVADYPDPDNFLYILFHSRQFGEKGNHTWYANAKVDELTEQARKLTRMEDRVPLYHQAEDIVLDECPWIPTYHVRNIVLLRKEVRGVRENVTGLDTGTEFQQVDFGQVEIAE